MSVLLVGVSHKSAPVSVLESLALDADGVAKLTHGALQTEYVTEVIVLSTCNRVEVYAAVDRFHGSVEDVSQLLADRAGFEVDDVVPHLYVHYDDAAVAHLFSVVSGLDSMVVGESQILAQVRIALQRGQEHTSVGHTLNELFQQALRVGKRGHAETGIDQAAPTLIGIALDQVEQLSGVPPLKASRALVIGAGAMASLATQTLVRRDVRDLVVVNRTEAKAERLATSVGGRSMAVDDLAPALAGADIVVSCTGAIGTVLTVQQVREAMAARPGACLVIIDLALPHDVEPGAELVPGVTVVDLASLATSLADAEVGADIARVRQIVAEEVAAFLAALNASRVTPTVVALRTMATDVVESELDRLQGRLPDLDERTRAEVTHTVRRVADKLLHTPTVRIKELAASSPGAVSYADALADLFSLDPQAVRQLTQPGATGLSGSADDEEPVR